MILDRTQTSSGVSHMYMLNVQCTCILDLISCTFESQTSLPIKIVLVSQPKKINGEAI